MEKTRFAGLTALGLDDSVYADGGSFLSRNPKIIDTLLEVGAVTHKHDDAAPLADPTDAPVAEVLDTGGAIPAATAVHVGYTYEDERGGETLLSPTAVVSTDAPMEPPSGVLTAVVATDAGSLLPGSYYYAITLLDDAGGETELGPAVSVVREPGSAVGRVTLSGLDEDLVDGAVMWRLYRAIGGGSWAFLLDGDSASIVDDGLDCADATIAPPSNEDQNSTNGANVVRFTVPALPAGAQQVNVYVSAEGTFLSPCFFDSYLVADVGTEVDVTSLALLEGAPPDVSTSIPGATKIDALTEIENLDDAIAAAGGGGTGGSPYLGAWDNFTVYQPGDLVRHDSVLWRLGTGRDLSGSDPAPPDSGSPTEDLGSTFRGEFPWAHLLVDDPVTGVAWDGTESTPFAEESGKPPIYFAFDVVDAGRAAIEVLAGADAARREDLRIYVFKRSDPGGFVARSADPSSAPVGVPHGIIEERFWNAGRYIAAVIRDTDQSAMDFGIVIHSGVTDPATFGAGNIPAWVQLTSAFRGTWDPEKAYAAGDLVRDAAGDLWGFTASVFAGTVGDPFPGGSATRLALDPATTDARLTALEP